MEEPAKFTTHLKLINRRRIVLASIIGLIATSVSIIFINLFEYETLQNSAHAYTLPSYITLMLLMISTIFCCVYCSNITTTSYKGVSYVWNFTYKIYLVLGTALFLQLAFDMPVIFHPDWRIIIRANETSLIPVYENKVPGEIDLVSDLNPAIYKPFWSLFIKGFKPLTILEGSFKESIHNISPPLFATSSVAWIRLKEKFYFPPLVIRGSICIGLAFISFLIMEVCKSLRRNMRVNTSLMRGNVPDDAMSIVNDHDSLLDDIFSVQIPKKRKKLKKLNTWLSRGLSLLSVVAMLTISVLFVLDHVQTEVSAYYFNDFSCAPVPAAVSDEAPDDNLTESFPDDSVYYANRVCLSDKVAVSLAQNTTTYWIEGFSEEPFKKRDEMFPWGLRGKLEKGDPTPIVPSVYTIVSPYIISGMPIIWMVVMCSRVVSLMSVTVLMSKKLQGRLLANILLIIGVLMNLSCVILSHPRAVSRFAGPILGDITATVNAMGVSPGDSQLEFPDNLYDHYAPLMHFYGKEYGYMRREVQEPDEQLDEYGQPVLPGRKLNTAVQRSSFYSQYGARKLESLYFCLEQTSRSIISYYQDNPDLPREGNRVPKPSDMMSYCNSGIHGAPWRSIHGLTTLIIFGIPLMLTGSGLALNIYLNAQLKKEFQENTPKLPAQSPSTVVPSTGYSHQYYSPETVITQKGSMQQGLHPHTYANHLQVQMAPQTHKSSDISPPYLVNGGGGVVHMYPEGYQNTYPRQQFGNRPLVRGYTPSLTPRSLKAAKAMYFNTNND